MALAVLKNWLRKWDGRTILFASGYFSAHVVSLGYVTTGVSRNLELGSLTWLLGFEVMGIGWIIRAPLGRDGLQCVQQTTLS